MWSSIALLYLGLLGGTDAQFTDGGAVELTCGACECAGVTDDGADVTVLDIVSIGKRVRSRKIGLTSLVPPFSYARIVRVLGGAAKSARPFLSSPFG